MLTGRAVAEAYGGRTYMRVRRREYTGILARYIRMRFEKVWYIRRYRQSVYTPTSSIASSPGVPTATLPGTCGRLYFVSVSPHVLLRAACPAVNYSAAACTPIKS